MHLDCEDDSRMALAKSRQKNLSVYFFPKVIECNGFIVIKQDI